jgi:hypothetical protein
MDRQFLMDTGPQSAVSPKAIHCRRRYVLRTLLVLLVIIVFACSWPIANRITEIRRQKAAVAQLRELGATVKHDYERFAACDFNPEPESIGSQLMRLAFGDDSVGAVEDVDLDSEKVTDADLQLLRGMDRLRSLALGRAKITDAGIDTIAELQQLEFLYFLGTPVTDGGLRKIARLAQLQTLVLNRTKVTDAGMENFRAMGQLDDLSLDGTKITDAGLAHLAGLKQLSELDLSNTEITDAGLKQLEGLPLEKLVLHSTNVTDAGLRGLKGLKGLKYLLLDEKGQITAQGAAELQKALPGCRIMR